MSGELKKSVEEVKWELECGKNGRPYSTIENAAIVFREDGLFAGKLRYNSFRERIEIIGELPWDRAAPEVTEMDDVIARKKEEGRKDQDGVLCGGGRLGIHAQSSGAGGCKVDE